MDETKVTPMAEEEAAAQTPAMVEVVDVQFRPGQKVYFFDPAGMKIATGTNLIIDTSRGPEFGICTGGNHMIPEKDVVAPLRSVIRLATEADEKTVAENRQKEKKAYNVCLQKIADHGLDMQLVSAEYAFDGSKILFFFTADERVDFRELVKNLASVFHTRIELRQIGVRDKAKMVGGLGICGRPFCCAQFLDDFQPVSIKMAKTQNLSLNPSKISGTCGRLMCCLKYEQEAYEDLIRTSPKAESFVDTPDGRGTVVDVNLLRQSVKVRMEDNPETIGCYHNCDICVLRNGKAKKSDPPIPADLAPISGSGKQAKNVQAEEPAFLEPVKFRYRTESLVDEPEQKEEPIQAVAEASESRSSRRRRRAKAARVVEDQQLMNSPDKAEKPQKPKVEKKAEAPREDAPKGEEAPAKSENHRRRRPNHHRRRKPKSGGEGGQEG